MGIIGRSYFSPPKTIPADAAVPLAAVLRILDEHILTFTNVAGGYRTALLLRAIRVAIVELAKL